MNRRKFSDGLKADAVALVEESGGQIAEVAKELGVYHPALGNWVRQAASVPMVSRHLRSVPRSAS